MSGFRMSKDGDGGIRIVQGEAVIVLTADEALSCAEDLFARARALQRRVRWKEKSPDEREAFARRARERWEATPLEVRMERAAKARATFAKRYPNADAFRAQVQRDIAEGRLIPQPCDRCSGEAAPLLSIQSEEVLGWRCHSCRTAK